MKRNINSNGYIFLYSTILVVVVAVVLTLAALWLQPYQQRNRDNEQRIRILQAAGIPNVTKENATALYEKHCTASLLLDSKGNPTDQGELPLYVIDNHISVLPMKGSGLWGPIWGYIAIGPDGNTVIGANFDHKSETPGLGGEITKEKFRRQFAGKRFFDHGQLIPIEVDAITGSTITSRAFCRLVSTAYKAFETTEADEDVLVLQSDFFA